MRKLRDKYLDIQIKKEKEREKNRTTNRYSSHVRGSYVYPDVMDRRVTKFLIFFFDSPLQHPTYLRKGLWLLKPFVDGSAL